MALRSAATGEELRYAADFMDLGVGVRELAMGSTAALATGGTADWWNVSRLSSVRSDEIGLHHTFYGGGLASLDYVGYARPLGGATIVSASVLRFAVDAIPRYDQTLDPNGRAERESNVAARPSAEPTGYFDAQDLGFRLSLSRRSERIVDFGWLYSPFPLSTGYGGSVKYISQSLDDNIAVGLGGDVGAHVRIGAAEMIGLDLLGDVHCGVSLIDIAGTQITWDTPSRSKASLPMRARLDLGYSQPFPAFSSELILTWAKVWDLQDGGRDDKGMGVEWSFKNMAALRAGEHRGELTAGAGFRAWKIEVDYAFLSAEVLENHRIDLTFYPWD